MNLREQFGRNVFYIYPRFLEIKRDVITIKPHTFAIFFIARQSGLKKRIVYKRKRRLPPWPSAHLNTVGSKGREVSEGFPTTNNRLSILYAKKKGRR